MPSVWLDWVAQQPEFKDKEMKRSKRWEGGWKEQQVDEKGYRKTFERKRGNKKEREGGSLAPEAAAGQQSCCCCFL